MDNLIPSETIKRLSLPRRPAGSKESTSAGLISDLHRNRSCLPLFFSPDLHPFLPADGGRADVSSELTVSQASGEKMTNDQG